MPRRFSLTQNNDPEKSGAEKYMKYNFILLLFIFLTLVIISSYIFLRGLPTKITV